MERIYRGAALCALALCLLLCPRASFGEPIPSVAVLDFESIGSEEFLGRGVSEIMRTELVGTKKFRVVERSQMKKALEEQKLHLTGIIDDKTAVEVGKLHSIKGTTGLEAMRNANGRMIRQARYREMDLKGHSCLKPSSFPSRSSAS